MTLAVAGFKGKALASTSTGSAVAKIAEVRNWSLMADQDELDVTSQESSGDREFISGLGRWSAKIEQFQLSTVGGHQALYDVLKAKTRCNFEFYPTGSSSQGVYSGAGFIQHWELNDPNDDAAISNVEVQGTGSLTRA